MKEATSYMLEFNIFHCDGSDHWTALLSALQVHTIQFMTVLLRSEGLEREAVLGQSLTWLYYFWLTRSPY